jgi:large subunit ribosomal protein L11
VVITVYTDRSFSFETKTPPASFFLKKAARLQKGGATPKRASAGTVTWSQVREIAQKKMKDLNANDVDAAAKIVAGSARSMGIDVVEG